MPAIGFDPCPIYGKAPFSACEDCQSRCHPLPVLMAMVEQREVVPGKYSVTEILKPLQAIKLSRDNGYYIDPVKAIYMINGTAVHKIIEDGGRHISNLENHKMEEQFEEEIIDGYFLTGKPDYYNCVFLEGDEGILWDYKNIKVYPTKLIKSASINKVSWASEDYFAQLNIYKVFKYPTAKQLKLYCMVQGWTKRETGISPIEQISVPVAPPADVRLWIKNRFHKIREMEMTGVIPLCLKGDYLKYHTTENGSPTRCAEYCNARDFCPQAKELIK
jgi:hypothetical protein